MVLVRIQPLISHFTWQLVLIPRMPTLCALKFSVKVFAEVSAVKVFRAMIVIHKKYIYAKSPVPTRPVYVFFISFFYIVYILGSAVQSFLWACSGPRGIKAFL